MPAKSTTFQDPAPNAAQTVTENVSEAASQVKDKVLELGQTAVDKIEENRRTAASGLESAASALHEKAESLPGGGKVAGFAHSAADKISSTAEYVREHDVKSMMADVEELARNNPGPSLLAAAIVGFLVGRAFSSND
jgi:ElaB/YqjD/DUF883 family membrane-anchored ribosome-binding protein